METWQLKSPLVLGIYEWLRKQEGEQMRGRPQVLRQGHLKGGASELRSVGASTSPVSCGGHGNEGVGHGASIRTELLSNGVARRH